MRAWLSSRLRRPSPAMLVGFLALLVALGGTAYAATTIVNIADPTTPANKAKVDTTGALKTAGTSTVSGFVGETTPKTPFTGGVFAIVEEETTVIAANKRRWRSPASRSRTRTISGAARRPVSG